jgi:hypothetical protein
LVPILWRISQTYAGLYIGTITKDPIPGAPVPPVPPTLPTTPSLPGAPAGHLWFEYQKRKELSDPNNNIYSGSRDLVTNMGNVPYGTPVYNQINSPGRYWIQQYSAALAKEMLGLIRGKYTTIQIPGAETTLNQSDLLSQAAAEKTALMERLRGDLDAVSRKAQLEQKQSEALALKSTLNEIPLQIYIG